MCIKYEITVHIFFCAKRDTLRCTNYITTLEKLKCLLLCKQVPNFTFFSYILLSDYACNFILSLKHHWNLIAVSVSCWSDFHET